MTEQRKTEWFDDDSFWEEFYDYMFTEERFVNASEQMEKVLRLTNPNGKSALDLCCGPGRCAIPLAHAGFTVTGVDRTEFLLEKARERAKEAGVAIKWTQSDMRDFVRKDAYDLVINMFTSFGYFDDKQEDMLVLQNMHECLRPGGACVIDVVGKEWLAKVFQPTTSSVEPDGTQLIQIHEIYDNWTRIRNEWMLIRGDKVRSFKFHHTIYSGQELKDRLIQAGFADVKLYGNLDGDAYGPDGKRLIAVATKAD